MTTESVSKDFDGENVVVFVDPLSIIGDRRDGSNNNNAADNERPVAAGDRNQLIKNDNIFV